MDTRDETIEKVSRLLNEDITNQFAKNEVNAALEGRNYFQVKNTSGEGILVEFLYYESIDSLDYLLKKVN